MSESCPKCGMAQTGKIDEGYRHFDCFSFAHESGAAFQQSKQCTALAGCRDLIATQRTRIAEAGQENARLREAIQKIKANSYLDDDVLNRHNFTTTGCEALREAFALLAKPEGAK